MNARNRDLETRIKLFIKIFIHAYPSLDLILAGKAYSSANEMFISDMGSLQDFIPDGSAPAESSHA